VTSIRPGQLVASNDAGNGPQAALNPADHATPLPGRFTEPTLWALVIRHARCSQSGLDPDQWFPVSADPSRARQEAAAAIAVCATCPVRGHCLTLSLHRWDIGQHGVWGGLVAADRARLRRRAHPHRGWTEEQVMASLGASQRAAVLAGACEDTK
jgi:Transcription factor WhiB